MAREVLTNPVIEEFRYEIVEDAQPADRHAYRHPQSASQPTRIRNRLLRIGNIPLHSPVSLAWLIAMLVLNLTAAPAVLAPVFA